MQGSTDIAPPRRSRFVDLVKAGVAAGLRSGALGEASLDRQAITEAAIARAGSDDFGDPWFTQPMDALIAALEEEAQLHVAGRWVARKQLEKVLVDRLWAQQWFARHPEILARPLRRPVIIVGPMRSGTTRLHRLLASDRRFNHMRSFETLCPVPPPGFVHGGKDNRIVLARRARAVAQLANPRTLAIHPTGPLEPEEELGLLVNSLWGMKHEAQWFVPGYGRWCEGQDATPAYRQMARLLQLIGWSQQASSLKPWVLKTPQHMLDLPALLAVFPDARLIFTHRNPCAVVGSAASLAWNQTCIYSDQADPAAVGAEWLRKTRVQVERMRTAREGIDPARAIDIPYDEVERDWRAAMGRIYAFLGLDIGPAMAEMEAYTARTANPARPSHHYSLAQFGLTEGAVLEQLGDYVRAFDIALVGEGGSGRSAAVPRAGRPG